MLNFFSKRHNRVKAQGGKIFINNQHNNVGKEFEQELVLMELFQEAPRPVLSGQMKTLSESDSNPSSCQIRMTIMLGL
jgi:hypothetical protein